MIKWLQLPTLAAIFLAGDVWASNSWGFDTDTWLLCNDSDNTWVIDDFVGRNVHVFLT